MKNKNVFMQVDELGDLFLFDVLLEFIYPRVFICEDIYRSKYLFYEVSSDGEKDTWVVTKVTDKEYYSLVDRKKPIQKSYENKRGFSLFTLSQIYSEQRVILSFDAKEWIKQLPKEPVFAEREVCDYSSETLEVARKTGKTTFDIRLFRGTDRHYVPQNTMTELCSAMTSLTNSVFGNRRKEPMRVATASGSCIVRFSFPDQINLFNETDAENELKVINRVLASDSILDGLEKVKNQTGFIKSYMKILDCIRKTYSDVQFSTASPNSSDVQIIELSSEMVKKRYECVKNINRIEKDEKDIVGILIALDMKTKKFKLQCEDESILSGRVMREFFDGEYFELPRKYKARIEEERIRYVGESSSKVNYYLRSLTVC